MLELNIPYVTLQLMRRYAYNLYNKYRNGNSKALESRFRYSIRDLKLYYRRNYR